MASANSTLRLSVDNSQYNQGLRDATKKFSRLHEGDWYKYKEFYRYGHCR